jgi:MerR family transcriptional regulator, heat shock protein HspR
VSTTPRMPGQPGPEVPVYVISVAAELTGLHPQTLRAYDRIGLVKPGRSGGGGRRYSWHDIEMLREVAELTASGIGLEGVRRILDLENKVTALRIRVAELEEELAVTRFAHEQAVQQNQTRTQNKNLPAVRAAADSAGQAITVWRRSTRGGRI